MLDPEPGKCVRRLQAAGPATDDDDRILAGRVDSLYDRQARTSCNRRASVTRIRYITCG